METEIWKAHPDIVGIEVSTLGRVRTLDKVTSSEKYTRFTKGHVLKQCNDKDGYLMVSVPVDGKWTMKKVHRLVAQTFIKNPDNLPQVNHLDCNRKNNNVKNLEFCTVLYNAKYREKFGTSNAETKGQPVFAINLSTLEVSRFCSKKEAGRELGVFDSHINDVIKGKYKQTGGYWFMSDDGRAVDVVKSNLHDIGGIGLKIKQGR